MEEGELESQSQNSEIRFIALELMKIAQKSNRKFDDVAEEYIKNTIKLQDLISSSGEEPAGENGKVCSRNHK